MEHWLRTDMRKLTLSLPLDTSSSLWALFSDPFSAPQLKSILASTLYTSEKCLYKVTAQQLIYEALHGKCHFGFRTKRAYRESQFSMVDCSGFDHHQP
jgi:hypothetical protein